jgi:hypothetical protein
MNPLLCGAQFSALWNDFQFRLIQCLVFLIWLSLGAKKVLYVRESGSLIYSREST